MIIIFALQQTSYDAFTSCNSFPQISSRKTWGDFRITLEACWTFLILPMWKSKRKKWYDDIFALYIRKKKIKIENSIASSFPPLACSQSISRELKILILLSETRDPALSFETPRLPSPTSGAWHQCFREWIRMCNIMHISPT